jgi:YfiH family protein
MWVRTEKGFVLEGTPNVKVEVSREPTELSLRLKQVHGARVVVYRGQEEEVADGVITDIRGASIGVKVADCYPIFLVADGVVGVLHAGWRGSVKGILYDGLSLLHGEWGVDPEDVTVAFGPGICGKCYEVGEDLKPHFGTFLKPKGNGKYLLDLYEYNLRILKKWGVKRIIPPPSCTYEDLRLYSHRRGDKGRLYAYAQLL